MCDHEVDLTKPAPLRSLDVLREMDRQAQEQSGDHRRQVHKHGYKPVRLCSLF